MTIRGANMTITLLPAALRLTIAAIATHAAMAGAATIGITVTDRNGVRQDDAVVYAVPPVEAKPARPARAAIIDQVNKEFVPYVSVVQTGTAVNFPNKDNIRHQVYSFSPAKTFELKLYSGTPSAPIVFDKAGLVVLGCNIHDWMLGYVLVVDTPHFAKTVKGAAQIDLPAESEYEVRVWHPQLRGTPPAQKIRTDAGGPGTLVFAIDLAPKPAPGGANPARKDAPR